MNAGGRRIGVSRSSVLFVSSFSSIAFWGSTLAFTF